MKPVASVALLVVVLAAPPVSAQSVEVVLDRAAVYIAAYERELGILIAEERYVQEAIVQRVAGLPFSPSQPSGSLEPTERTITRQLLSEFLLVRVLGDANQWLGVREVLTVDDQPVLGRTPRLRQLLLGSPETFLAESQRIADESAQFNIGDIARGVHVPTFALLVLRAENQPRFAFEKDGEEVLEGRETWEVAFEERGTPTLLRDGAGNDLRARGTIWIEPATGRVVRTELRTEEASTRVEARVTVSYRPDADLGVWVPYMMTERYIADRNYQIRPQRIYCVAEYSKFRRFQPDAR